MLRCCAFASVSQKNNMPTHPFIICCSQTALQNVFKGDMVLAADTLRHPSIKKTTLFQVEAALRSRLMTNKALDMSPAMFVEHWVGFRNKKTQQQNAREHNE